MNRGSDTTGFSAPTRSQSARNPTSDRGADTEAFGVIAVRQPHPDRQKRQFRVARNPTSRHRGGRFRSGARNTSPAPAATGLFAPVFRLLCCCPVPAFGSVNMSSGRVDDAQMRHLRVLRAGGDELRAGGLLVSVSLARPSGRARAVISVSGDSRPVVLRLWLS